MPESSLNRRRFLVAAIALAAASACRGSALTRQSRLWESSDPVDSAKMSAMVRVARLLYPHEALSDEVYAEILDVALEATAVDARFAAYLDAVFEALGARTKGRWPELEEGRQIAALQEIEDTAFFKAIQDAVRAGVYQNPLFWAHIGYPGSSKEFGGYLDRGAGEIDWLPEAS